MDRGTAAPDIISRPAGPGAGEGVNVSGVDGVLSNPTVAGARREKPRVVCGLCGDDSYEINIENEWAKKPIPPFFAGTPSNSRIAFNPDKETSTAMLRLREEAWIPGNRPFVYHKNYRRAWVKCYKCGRDLPDPKTGKVTLDRPYEPPKPTGAKPYIRAATAAGEGVIVSGVETSLSNPSGACELSRPEGPGAPATAGGEGVNDSALENGLSTTSAPGALRETVEAYREYNPDATWREVWENVPELHERYASHKSLSSAYLKSLKGPPAGAVGACE